MVWGCFAYFGVGPIYHITGTMDQFQYLKILEEVMLPYTEKEMPLKWVFQQNNDPKHTSKQVTSWLQTKKSPAQSLDLNLIENLWCDLKNSVCDAKPKEYRKSLECGPVNLFAGVKC